MTTFSFSTQLLSISSALTRPKLLCRLPSAAPKFYPATPRARVSSAHCADRSCARRCPRAQTTNPAIVQEPDVVPAWRTHRKVSALAPKPRVGNPHAPPKLRYLIRATSVDAPGPLHLGTRERTIPTQQTGRQNAASDPVQAPPCARAPALAQTHRREYRRRARCVAHNCHSRSRYDLQADFTPNR